MIFFFFILGAAAEELCRQRPDVDVLLYNRVPKCASTSMKDLFIEESAKLGFKVLVPLYLFHANESMLVDSFQKIVCNETVPVIVVNHMLFPSAAVIRSLTDCGKTVGFFNIVREPLARHRSHYEYLRLGDRDPAKKLISQQICNMTYDECIDGDPVPECCAASNLLLEFMSGLREKDTTDPLQILTTAVFNVQQRYSVIGLAEEMERTVRLVRFIFPQFATASAVLPRSNETPRLARSAALLHRPSNATRRLLFRAAFARDTAFYHFLRRRFHHQAANCLFAAHTDDEL